ncbi:hypothetical protein HA402_005329 [Bradysia odoriphaga]|nr:hypothetical protein HA402_005329 [Bradysia odoriphaga]
MLKVEWAPLNVPLRRRLQTISVAIEMFLVVLGNVAALIIFGLLLFKGNTVIRVLCVVYMGFMYYDRDAGKNGGRGFGSQWFRSLTIWSYFVEYFPIDLVKTVDIDANQNYIFAMFPHGVLSSSAFGNFNTNYSKWKTLFPGIRSKIMTLDFHFYVPLFREVVLAWGMGSCAAQSIKKLLNQSNDIKSEENRDGYTSNAVLIFVGGAQEALYCHPRNYTLVLKKRKGFIKLAMATGSSLVPCISFNEVDIFDQPANPPGSKMRKFQDYIRSVTGVTPVLFNGRGFFQYSYGWLPKRRSITTVVGSPLVVEKNENPSPEQVDKLHDRFCEHLNDLFETHKAKYIEDHEEVHLNII